MAADKNKVEFGISELHVGTYTVDPDTGVATLGTPYHQKGAVTLSVEAESDSNDFYADNIKYWSGFSDNGFTGSIEVARFDNDFKTQFLGYKITADGGVASVKNATKPDVYIAFQTEGNVEPRRVLLLNVALGAISREFSTIEETKEPVTESLDITVTGDNNSGITKVNYKPDDAGYATLFTAPTVPTIPDKSE